MTEYIQMLRNRFIYEAKQKSFRQQPVDPFEFARTWAREGLPGEERAVRRLSEVLKREKPVVWPDEKIALIRTVPVLPELFTEEEQKKIHTKYYIHEKGKVCNITPEYSLLLDCGFDRKRAQISRLLKDGKGAKDDGFLRQLLRVLDAVEDFADRYRKAAEEAGNRTVAETLSVIPRKKPKTFLQALQFLRLLHYCLWASYNYHNTFGRFDQYMLPYYKADVESGRLTRGQALELLEEFFISCNKDSDLYQGMQQGDNGQSIVLGGFDRKGNYQYNELSELCMKACEELHLIDPKINLRVGKKTPLSLYVRGSEMTKLGLGFPQYSNDDVVIPCLLHWGYSPEDAYNYSVAACWEFIIPGYGMDIPNINALSFPAAVQAAMPRLPECNDFDSFLNLVHSAIREQADRLIASVGEIYMEPAPMMSLMMRDCVENRRDISLGGRYNNFGFHGAGLSTAVDSLAAIRKYVFEDKRFSPEKMLDMTRKNFVGYETEDNLLRYEAPKMGNDDDRVDSLATALLDWFADALEGKHNSRGGIYRAGTGSAMYYIWYSQKLGATADGRHKGEGLACNYSPSLFSRCRGPVSIIKSFAKPHLVRVANGGPLTIELDDTMFRNKDSVRKVGMFVKSFIDMGGHQMQINSVDRDTILDAKKHPEKHRNLIVRVWGWSGYFVELDEVYQNHILKRMELKL